MICVIDESSPHNWAASDFSEHWLSIISNIWNSYGIHKQRAGWGLGVGCHHREEFKGEAGQSEAEVSREFTRRNVNSADGWVSKALCCPEEVWSRAAGPPANRPRLCGNGICALGRAFFCSCCALTVYESHIWGLPSMFSSPDVLTYRLARCWVCRWCTSDVQTEHSSVSKPFQSFPRRATPRPSATGLKVK